MSSNNVGHLVTKTMIWHLGVLRFSGWHTLASLYFVIIWLFNFSYFKFFPSIVLWTSTLQRPCFWSTRFISFSELVVSSACSTIVCISTQNSHTYLLSFIICLLFGFWDHFIWGYDLLPDIFLLHKFIYFKILHSV